MWKKRLSENLESLDSILQFHLRDLVASKLLSMVAMLKVLLNIILTSGQMYERAKMKLEKE